MGTPLLSSDDLELVNQKENTLIPFIGEGHKHLPEIYSSEGSCAWAIQSGEAAPYIKAGALRKVGGKWKFNPRKVMRAFLELPLTEESSETTED